MDSFCIVLVCELLEGFVTIFEKPNLIIIIIITRRCPGDTDGMVTPQWRFHSGFALGYELDFEARLGTTNEINVIHRTHGLIWTNN